MKDPGKNMKEALKIMRANSYKALDSSGNLVRKPSNHILYYQAEREFILAQEEIGRRNKTTMRKEAKGNPFLTERLKRGELNEKTIH